MLASGERKTVHNGGAYARYVPSGHLVYVNKGTLFAVPFDPDRLVGMAPGEQHQPLRRGGGIGCLDDQPAAIA